MSQMIRFILTVFYVVLLLLCAAMEVLWVRSYVAGDTVYYSGANSNGGKMMAGVGSQGGFLALAFVSAADAAGAVHLTVNGKPYLPSNWIEYKPTVFDATTRLELANKAPYLGMAAFSFQYFRLGGTILLTATVPLWVLIIILFIMTGILHRRRRRAARLKNVVRLA